MLMDSQLCNKPQCRDSGFVQSHHARQQQKSAKVVLGRVLINAQIGGPLGGQSGKHLLILSLSAFDP
jgi:hypothetical protein